VLYPKATPSSQPARDSKLVQIIDAALLDSEWPSGEWLICKPGCTPCCIGVFAGWVGKARRPTIQTERRAYVSVHSNPGIVLSQSDYG